MLPAIIESCVRSIRQKSVLSGCQILKARYSKKPSKSLGERKNQRVSLDSCAAFHVEVTASIMNTVILGKVSDVICTGSQIDKICISNADSELFCCGEMSELAKYLTAKGSRVDAEIRYVVFG